MTEKPNERPEDKKPVQPDETGAQKEELEQVTGKTYGKLHIVGGGANADFLNQLTADETGCPVYAGPTEATAIGNLAVQMIGAGVYGNLKEAREGIFRSFDIKKYEPQV